MFDNWEPATAKIVAKKFKTGSVEAGSVVDYVADVTPDSGAPPFRTVLHEPIMHTSFRGPGEGSVVRVEANVKKQKATFDLSDPNLSIKGAFQSEKDTFDGAKASVVGTPVQAADPLGGEDPRINLAQMGIRTATRKGDMAEVARFEEMIRQIEAGELPMPGAGGPVAPAAADPIAQIEKLAALHESGALTAAEFAEQKSRILSQL
jgi:hypothetical protein